MTELTDAQLCDIARSTQTAEPGRDGYVLPVAFGRAVLAAHRGKQDAEIERLRADANRYQWLRDPRSGAENTIVYERGDFGSGLMSGTMLDKAIDAAMEEKS